MELEDLFYSSLCLSALFLACLVLVKQGKNHICWNDNPPKTFSRADDLDEKDGSKDGTATKLEKLRSEVDSLREQESQLDRYLDFLSRQSGVFSPSGVSAKTGEYPSFIPPGLENAARYMYVIYTDITSLPIYGHDTIIGIKAPSGTSLEVPDPDQGMRPGMRRFQMYLSSRPSYGPGPDARGGPINVYLIRPKVSGQKSASAGTTSRSQTASPGGYVLDTPARYGEGQRGGHGYSPHPDSQKRPYGKLKDAPFEASHPEPSWGPPPHAQQLEQGRSRPKQSEEDDARADKAEKEAQTSEEESPSRILMPRTTPERAIGEESPLLYSHPSRYFDYPREYYRDPYYTGTPQRPLSPPRRYNGSSDSRAGPAPLTPRAPPSFAAARSPQSSHAQYDLMNMPLQSPTSRGYGMPPPGPGYYPSPGMMHSPPPPGDSPLPGFRNLGRDDYSPGEGRWRPSSGRTPFPDPASPLPPRR